MIDHSRSGPRLRRMTPGQRFRILTAQVDAVVSGDAPESTSSKYAKPVRPELVVNMAPESVPDSRSRCRPAEGIAAASSGGIGGSSREEGSC